MSEDQPSQANRRSLGSITDRLFGSDDRTEAAAIFLEHEPTPEEMLTLDLPTGLEEVDRYWVNHPYAMIAILYNDEESAHEYHVIEPELTEFEHRLLEVMLRDLRDLLIHSEAEWEDEAGDPIEDTAQVFQRAMIDLLNQYGLRIDPASFYRVFYYVWRTYAGYGKLDPIVADTRIEDISADGYNIPIYIYHEQYQNMASNVVFEEEELDSFIIRLAQEAGKNISLEKPYVSGTLTDGSRIELTYGEEVTRHGSTFTVRKFAKEPYTPIDLINYGTFSIEQMAYLWIAIENNKSLIFAGGTASGKTTSLNAVSMFLPPRSKVVTIEDTPEINLSHENWVPAVTREGPSIETEIDMFTLLRSSLRQRPEYIIVGEVRGDEALTLFQAMNTGHTTYSTIHAESVQTVIRRLENPPIDVPRAMIGALDIISVQLLTRVDENRVRRTDTLVEITGLDERTGDINFVELFDWDPESDAIDRTGNSTILDEIANDQGLRLSDLRSELRNRERVLRYLQTNEVSGYHDFTQVIHEYYAAPDRVLGRIGSASVSEP